MIGLIVSGRPVQTFESVPGDLTQRNYISTITDADNMNHIVVFLSQPLPDGYGAGVHFSWPGAGDEAQEWHYLGHLSNQKPSSIYKIVKPRRTEGDQVSANQAHTLALFGGTPRPNVATVGVTLDALNNLEVKQSAAVESSQKTNLQEFCEKMLQNFINYTMSFAIQDPSNPTEVFVPMKTINGWFEKYKRRLETDPNFWKTSS